MPTFFVISSFLFFRKARYASDSLQLLTHFLKRLCILYLFWSIVWSPIIYIQKSYFHPITAWTPLYVILDFFFGNMFDASWFLGGLLVGVSMVWALSRVLKKDVLVMVIPLLTYLFLQFVDHLPEAWRAPYQFYNSFHNPRLTFLGGLLWIAIGYVMANKTVTAWMDRRRNSVAWTAALVLFILTYFVPIVPNILCVAALFIAAYTWHLPEHPQLYRRLRTYSILFYVIHGCFKKIPKQLFGWENGPLLFVVTIAFCFLVSEIIIRMKKVKGFGWLKYAY